MIDGNYRTAEEIVWLETELKGSNDDWKIAVFHHPLYSSGGRHGPDVKPRETLEPLFVAYNVSVVFAGHDHVCERIKSRRGIMYFTVGFGGQLAVGDINKRSTTLTAKGFDTDNVFLAVEIEGGKMYFNAISLEGQVVDSGIIERRLPVANAAP
jgi:tartrate-resistant acid phosphatase type 5